MAEPSVSAGFARGLVTLAVSKGASEAALLGEAGIPAAALQEPDKRIGFARYVALMRAAKVLTGDPALALHYGEVNISEASIVGLIGEACETMLEAFIQLNRYVRLVVDVQTGSAPRFQFRQAGGAGWVADTRDDPNGFPELTESAFAQIICSPRRLGAGNLAQEVHVSHPAPAYRAEYERVFQAPVVFESHWNAFRIDPAVMAHRVARLPRYAFGVLSARADALLAELETASSVSGRIEALLLPVLHTGEASMERVAAKLALSRQTLFRRLKEEGTTFERLLDGLRRRMALDYLQARKVSINETAYLTGFSDPAAFSRAFKRWTGQSPRAWRAARQADRPSFGEA